MKTLIAVIIFAFILIGCGHNPVSPVATPADTLAIISTRYIADTYTGPSCWRSTSDPYKDSLTVDSNHYVISKQSRYRRVIMTSTIWDVIAEGAVTMNNWTALHDTKTDSIYIFNQCKGN